MKSNGHEVARIACLIISFILVVGLFCVYFTNREPFRIVSVISADKKIEVNWQTSLGDECKKVIISIKDQNGECVETKECYSFIEHYAFHAGHSNQRYSITVVGLNDAGETFYEESFDRLMLDYDELPNLPLLNIETEKGKEPTYSVATPDEKDSIGSTIIDNEYVVSKIVCTGFENYVGSQGGKIKIRGNTSSLNSEKKSYKIELDNATKLLTDEPALKEWVLLNSGTNLKTYVGCLVGEACEMEWQPSVRFVNVMLNGDWKGIYYLIPAVGRESAGDLVEKSGSIFEADAYWWSEDDCNFRTEFLSPAIRYTFKYPKIKHADDERLAIINKKMQEIENSIVNGEEMPSEIDKDSWIKWILARDIISNRDGAGTNVFYYIKSINEKDSMVKMGPLWDFDRAFEMSDIWSDCRTAIATYFGWLFTNEEFEEEYRREWGKVSPSIYSYVASNLKMENEVENEIDKSYYLDGLRWGEIIEPYGIQERKILEWMLTHIAWINNELKEPNYIAMGEEEYEVREGCVISNIDILEPEEKGNRVEGWIYMDPGECQESLLVAGILIDDKLYLAEKKERPDVKEALGVQELNTGFCTRIPKDETFYVCFVDMVNKIVYR